MPFNRSSLVSLIVRITADIESRLPGAEARLRRKLTTAIGFAQAGAAHGLHGHLDWLAKQLMVDTAEDEYLDRLASIWLKDGRKPAVRAAGDVVLTGDDGSTLPEETLLQRSDGAEFQTLAEVVVAAGTATVAVEAVVAGDDANTLDGSTLTLVNPEPGVDNAGTVDASGLTGGYAQENNADLLSRVLYRLQNPPHGGAAHDYVAWAREVAGVTRAWCFPQNRGGGTVDIYFVVDNHEVSIIPDAAAVQAVQDHVDSVCSVTADFLAVAPTAAPLNFTIGLVPPTAEVKAAVQAELEDLLRREAEPGDGLNGGKIPLSHIREAISIAPGETDYTLTAPNADVVPAAGEIITMGVITWG